MAEVVTIKVTGAEELLHNIETLPPKIAKAIIRRSILGSIKIWQREMQSSVSRDTGFLADHIAIRSSVKNRDLTGIGRVGPVKIDYPRRVPKRGGKGRTISAAAVARYLEFGTRKMRARPFIRQAFETRKSAVLEAFITAARDAFDQESRS